MGVAVAATVAAVEAAAPGSEGDLSSEFDDPVEPLKPRRPPSEAELDRSQAELLYAQGRLLAQRGDHAAALRKYQRACRYDPQAVSLLDEVVSLCFRLNRNQEAARYAVISAQRNPRDAQLLQRLAMYLAESGQWLRAIEFYEQSIKMSGPKERSEQSAQMQFELGRLYTLSDQTAKAAESFNGVREALLSPDDAELAKQIKTFLTEKGAAGDAYALMAESFLAAGQHDRAEAFFRLADELAGDEYRLQLRLARVQSQRGEHRAALDALEKGLQSPGAAIDASGCKLFAELLSQIESDPAQAQQKLLARLEELFRAGDQKNMEVGLFLAGQLLAAERPDDARSIYERLLAVEAPPIVHAAWIEFLHRRGDADRLLDALGAAMELAPANDDLRTQIRQIAADPAAVENLLQAAERRRRQEPAELSSTQALAAAHAALAAEQASAAHEYFEYSRSAASAAEPDELVDWGIELLLADQPQLAADVFRQAIEADAFPDRPAALHFQLAGALALLDKTDEAVEAAEQAARLEPQNPQHPSRAAWALYRGNRFAEARQAYQALIEEFDDEHQSTGLRQAMRNARLALSSICLKLNDPQEAIEQLEQVLDEFPEDSGALNDLGYLWADRGEHLNRALQMTEQAVAAEPDNAAYRDSLGWAYYRLARYAEAVQQLQQAVALDEPDGVILDHLGDAYFMASEPEKALAAWKEAAAIFERQGEQELLKRAQEKIADRSASARQKPPPD